MREIWAAAKPATLSLEDWTRGRQFQNRQTTVAATFKKDLSPQWKLNLMGSYDDWWFKHQLMGTQTNAPGSRRPVERASSSAARSPPGAPTEAHSLAFGSRGLARVVRRPLLLRTPSTATPLSPSASGRRRPPRSSASTSGRSRARVTAFASARVDKHTYSDWLFAPRGSLVFTPTRRRHHQADGRPLDAPRLRRGAVGRARAQEHDPGARVAVLGRALLRAKGQRPAYASPATASTTATTRSAGCRRSICRPRSATTRSAAASCC